MNGEYAEVIGLVSHANAFLNGTLAGSTLDLLSSTWPFDITEIEFALTAEGIPNADNKMVGNRIGSWFAYLRGSGALRLWACPFSGGDPISPRLLAAAAGGSYLAIQVDYDRQCQLWISSRDFVRASEPLRSHWSVLYTAIPLDQPVITHSPELHHDLSELKRCLHAIKEFAEKVHEYRFAEIFAKALALAEAPEFQSSSELMPATGYSLAARQLLAAADCAWVFGGMGSWNDIWFDDPTVQDECDRVSENLFNAVKNGLISAANSFAL